jgi:hypothetical protein
MIEKGTLHFILIEDETSRDELYARKIIRRRSSEIWRGRIIRTIASSLEEDPESCMEKAVLGRC